MVEVNDSNFLKKLFIDEAKPALEWFDFRWAGVPEGYERLEYIENAAATYIDTEITCNSNIELAIRVYVPVGKTSFYIFQSRESSSGDIHGIGGSSSDGDIQAYCTGSSIDSSVVRMSEHTYDIRMSCKDGVLKLYVKDLDTGEESDTKGTYTRIADATTSLGIFGTNFNKLSSGHRVYFASIIKDGERVANYIPARKDGSVGLYDSVTSKFLKCETGSLIAGPAR